jgi:hypothetical protein
MGTGFSFSIVNTIKNFYSIRRYGKLGQAI